MSLELVHLQACPPVVTGSACRMSRRRRRMSTRCQACWLNRSWRLHYGSVRVPGRLAWRRLQHPASRRQRQGGNLLPTCSVFPPAIDVTSSAAPTGCPLHAVCSCHTHLALDLQLPVCGAGPAQLGSRTDSIGCLHRRQHPAGACWQAAAPLRHLVRQWCDDFSSNA